MSELDCIRRPGKQSYFAVPDASWEEGWWGPATTPEGAIQELISSWDVDPLAECVVCIGYRVTRRRYPELFDGPECLSEYAYQVERPYVPVKILAEVTDRRKKNNPTGAPAPVEAEGGR